MAAGYKFYNIQEPLVLFRKNESYNSRKSTAYRVIDFKVRLKGYRLNHIPWYKRKYLMLPIALAIIPPKIMDKLFYRLKKLDPRNVIRRENEDESS